MFANIEPTTHFARLSGQTIFASQRHYGESRPTLSFCYVNVYPVIVTFVNTIAMRAKNVT